MPAIQERSVTGKHFLEINHVDPESLWITAHACSRIARATMLDCVPRAGARESLLGGESVSVESLRAEGYQPSHACRVKEGIESFYFKIEYRGVPMVAVLERRPSKPIVWITTYTRVIPEHVRTMQRWHTSRHRGRVKSTRRLKAADRQQYLDGSKPPRRKPRRRKNRKKDWGSDARER